MRIGTKWEREKESELRYDKLVRIIYMLELINLSELRAFYIYTKNTRWK